MLLYDVIPLLHKPFNHPLPTVVISLPSSYGLMLYHHHSLPSSLSSFLHPLPISVPSSVLDTEFSGSMLITLVSLLLARNYREVDKQRVGVSKA